jgi:hypothetical protein
MFTIIICRKDIINTVFRQLAYVGRFLVILIWVDNIKAQ